MDNLQITDRLRPFLDAGEIPGATLSFDKHTLTIPQAAMGTDEQFYPPGLTVN